jgi:hypothetical protein
MSKIVSLFLLCGILAACSHSVHLVHVSDFSPSFKKYEQGELIKAHSEQFVVMGFVTQTDYVDQAYNDLQSHCPKGTIQGITTQYMTDHGFFSWTNNIDMQGLCIR